MAPVTKRYGRMVDATRGGATRMRVAVCPSGVGVMVGGWLLSVDQAAALVDAVTIARDCARHNATALCAGAPGLPVVSRPHGKTNAQ